MSLNPIQISLVISVYNETKRLHILHHAVNDIIHNNNYNVHEIIIVDDGSTDNTYQRLKYFFGKTEQVKLIKTFPNRGKGAGLRTGIAASKGQLVLLSDADFSAPIYNLHILRMALHNDYVGAIGVRGSAQNDMRKSQPMARRVAGKLVRTVIKYFNITSISDTQCNFKLFKGDIIRSLILDCCINGFLFDLELLSRLEKSYPRKIAEVPITWKHVPESTVKINLLTIFGIARDFIRIWAIHHSLKKPTCDI